LDDDGLHFDEEEMAMIVRKFKKFFKKAKENSKTKNVSKPRGNEHEQFTGCFKCDKHDHIVKNRPLLKEEQNSEQFRNQGRKQLGTVLQGVFQRQWWLRATLQKTMRLLKKRKLP